MQIELSERQRATVAAAATIAAAAVILAAVVALFWAIGSFFAAFSNVFLPLAVAAVLAFVLRPYYELLNERLRFPRILAVAAVLLSLLLPVAGFAWFFGALAASQMTGLIDALPDASDRVVDWVTETLPALNELTETIPFASRVREAIENLDPASLLPGFGLVGDATVDVLQRVGAVLASLFAWAVLPVYLCFFLIIDPDRFRKLDHLFPFLKPRTREDVVYLIQEFIDILVAFFRGQLVVAFLQGALFAVGFSIAGLRYGLVLGLALGFLNIIPYLGSIVGLAVALPIGYWQEGGGLNLVIWVLVVFALVQLIEAYVLTPRIMGDRTGLHPMAIIVAVFFWGSALNGIAGMILAIPLTAFLVVFWRLARERYIGEVV
ncbi:MAG: AI-2E family transporter [Holophagales bacterium]|nr:AI-2E family transporter [Holophagales bacterium]MYG29245.1 AI-2E family transporter [Holophagales bacterium]MYI81185.1 AI-2E family transporter [Holophagales bacterium]